MSNNNNGGPAFARPGNEFRYADGEVVRFAAFGGMSLRDWFAGQALAGYVAQPDDRRFDVVQETQHGNVEAWRKHLRTQDAAYCYAIADAMLAERNKERL